MNDKRMSSCCHDVMIDKKYELTNYKMYNLTNGKMYELTNGKMYELANGKKYLKLTNDVAPTCTTLGMTRTVITTAN